MANPAVAREQYPGFMRIVDLISRQNPLQKKRIEAFISLQGVEYWTFAEELSRTLNHSFMISDAERAEAARCYNRMCMDILREQIRFKKTGTYLLDDAHQAKASVYSQQEVMRYYMVGLLLSYLFWPNHYQLFRFFRNQASTARITRYLEVGVGHGLFTAEIMRRFPEASVTLVDISETSISMAREMMATFQLDPARAHFVHGDYLTVNLDSEGYDFITMGEVLEHVNDGAGFLKRTRELLRPGGRLYLSTCANCPAIDHIHHFHNVSEIRNLIRNAGLRITRELALPADPMEEDRWEAELVTVNYCAAGERR